MPCHGCPVQKPCSKQTERVAQLEKRTKEFDRRIGRDSDSFQSGEQRLITNCFDTAENAQHLACKLPIGQEFPEYPVK
jgi:hypothetical protein